MAKPCCRLPASLYILVCLLAATFAAAQGPARFDLTGPKLDIHVSRNGVSLPIALVPNLQPGDQIWLHPDLPPTQSVKYLLIAAFLRGTTNPPPDDWFIRIETWKKEVREEGVTITVPADAQQAILFLAPETGGDFSTLRSAVKGRPGIFVRADQDLIEAGFEQARIEKYIAEMKQVDPSDAKAITDHSNLLARTLNLKPNPDCFKRPVDLQSECLIQTGSQTLLDDGHGQTMADTLNNSANSDLIYQAANTRVAGEGLYSAYVGAIVDLVRITSSLHTAQYQYIPAIAFPEQESLNLRLNTAPSFHNPKSVIVIGLPAVQKAVLPPLRSAEPNHTSCLLNPKMVLPIDGAPLVFSTSYAHQLMLHLNLPEGTSLPNHSNEIPLTPDAFQGGLTIAPPEPQRHELPVPPYPTATPPNPSSPAEVKPSDKPDKSGDKPGRPFPPTEPITGTVRGFWGFDSFTGPTLSIQALPGAGWHIVRNPLTPENLIAGQPNHLEIASTGTACIQSIGLEPGGEKVDWRLDETAELKANATTDTRPIENAALKLPDKPADKPADKSTTPPTSSTDKPKPAEASAIADIKAARPVAGSVHPVDLTLNLQHAATPGSIQLAIQQFAQPTPDQLGTKTFAEPAKIESIQYHAGDSTLQITGSGLDEVEQVNVKATTFIPPPPAPDTEPRPEAKPPTSLTFILAPGSSQPAIKPSEKLHATVQLNDGRSLESSTIALLPRPSISILSRRIISPAPSPISLSSPNEVPLGAQLVFFLKSKSNFPRTEQIEIANADSSLSTRLNLKDSTLVMQDTHTVLATFDPMKLFGPSSFGPFRLRPITPDGTEGEWQPLATIVRLPTLTQLSCSANAAASCLLTGQSLYLIDSIATTQPFTNPLQVPEGFVDTTLTIPHPTGPTFYLRLRDDPTAVQPVTLAITPNPPVAAPHTAQAHVPSSLSR